MRTAYHSLQKLFHWGMALMIVALLIVGYVMHGMETSPEKFQLYALHKATGFMVLALVVPRLLARLGLGVPPLPGHMPAWQRHAANLSHWGLYVLMVLMPLSGWLMSSSAGFPVSVYGWFVLPDPVGVDEDLSEFMEEVHEWLAIALIGLISAHALAALFHHFVQKDAVLRRMLPGGGAALALAVVALMPFGPALAAATAPEWTLVPAKSAIAFTAKVNGVPLKGNFERFTASIRFAPDDLEGSAVQVRVDMASVTMVNREAASVIQTQEWLATQNHKEAVFQSTRFEADGKKAYKVHGDLWIKGKKVPVVLDARVATLTGNEAEIQGELIIKRRDFAIGEGQWSNSGTVGEEVQVRFVAAATR